MSGFWRQWSRKELMPWQASACARPPPRTLQASASPPPPKPPTVYTTVYNAYNGSSPPARLPRTLQSSSASWSLAGPRTRAPPRLREPEACMVPLE